jgi:predicted dehydrogenase
MVGGGQGAFIGAVHRIAARIDGEYELVAGALSSDPRRRRASGAELGLDPDRAATAPSRRWRRPRRRARRHRGGGDRHAEPRALRRPAKAFLEAGIHVICDKPLTSNARRCEEAGGAAGEVRWSSC